MPQPHVVVVGSANQDLTSYTPNLPVMGETVMGDVFATSCGGKGANQAVAAASLALTPVTMVCRVGDDLFGQALLRKFAQSGVQYDTNECIIRDGNKKLIDKDGKETTTAPTSSGVASIVVDKKTGNNMIIVSPGANYKLTPDNVDKELRQLSPTVVVVQLEIKKESAIQALKTGKELGATTILNPAPAPDSPQDLQDYIPYTDILIPNESELRKICGKPEDATDVDEEELAKSLLDKGVAKAVIVTLGARGAMVMTSDGNVTYVAAPKELPCNDEPVTDTIGAGDAFCGTLASYMSSGLDLSEATTLACGYASMSVRRQGTDYPTFDDLPECLLVKGHADKKKSSGSDTAKKATVTFVSSKKASDAGIDMDSLPFQLTDCKDDISFSIDNKSDEPIELVKQKCKSAASSIKGPVLVQESSLEFAALNGMPGLHAPAFVKKCGAANLAKLLQAFDDKSATARTILAYAAGPDSSVQVFDAVTEGKIVDGSGGDDWDDVFVPCGSEKTFAQLDESEQHGVETVNKAFDKLKEYLKSNPLKA